MAVHGTFPATGDRVALATNPEVNMEIRQSTDDRVVELAHAGNDAINRRLEQLDGEWDIERALEANAATLALAGVVLGATVDRKFYAVSGIVAGFLLQHALQGWCPPLGILRRMGIRTAREIEHERCALKALRGDFAAIAAGGTESTNGHFALEAARRR